MPLTGGGPVGRRLRYAPALDGLRALAVSLVIVHHVAPEYSFAGHVGVDIFFVLSGYLITRLLLDEIDRTGRIGLVNFWLRRALRLYPALLAMLIGTAIVMVSYEQPLLYVVQAGVAATYLTNFAVLSGLTIGPLAHTWSLAMEEQFYLVWPLVLLAILRFRVRRRVLITALAVAIPASFAVQVVVFDYSENFNPLARAGGLLLGCLLAMNTRHLARPGIARLGPPALVVLVAVVTATSVGWFPLEFVVPAASLCSVPLIAYLTVGEGWLARAAAVGPLVHIGVLSYSLYLWHYPIFWTLQATGSPRWHLIAVGIPLTLAAAEVSRRLIERPFLKLKDRLPAPARGTDRGLVDPAPGVS